MIYIFAYVSTAEALAAQVTQENFDKGLIFPPFSNIRKISAHIAANVAAKAYELGEPFFSRPDLCAYLQLTSRQTFLNPMAHEAFLCLENHI